jgi:hypothetical protein
MRSYWNIWVGPKSKGKCPYETQKGRRHRRKPHDDEGRDWRYTSTRAKMQLELPEVERGREMFPLESNKQSQHF